MQVNISSPPRRLIGLRISYLSSDTNRTQPPGTSILVLIRSVYFQVTGYTDSISRMNISSFSPMSHWPTSSSAVAVAAAAAPEDEPLLSKRRMKAKSIAEFLAKLETSHESGLTNSQLMLTNDDLKPGRNLCCFLFHWCYGPLRTVRSIIIGPTGDYRLRLLLSYSVGYI